MGDKKRKREEAAGADQHKPKRVKNKAKYLPKGNKSRKRAATQLMNGANAIPLQGRVRNVPDAAEDAAESKPPGDDFFVIDTTPMNPAEVAEKIKSKEQIKRERQATKEAEHHTAEGLADKDARKEKKRKETTEHKERNDKKNAQGAQEKKKKEKEKKQKTKEMTQQEESRKRNERKEREDKTKETLSSKPESDSESDSSSDSSSSSGLESEVEVKKTSKATDKKSKKKEKPATEEAKQEEQPTNKNRFIVFVGNLPYTATTESVKAHFSKIAPISVRVATDKQDSGKCRGFGFVEFVAFDRMQTCLKLYHHSSFDDGKSPARKINVELTAGGGGKSNARRTKLKEKNQKLAEERSKNAQDEKKKKGGKESKEAEGGEYSGIHPSRLNQMR